MIPVITAPESLTPIAGDGSATDAALDLLSHRHRRAVLGRLADREEPVPIEDLAAELAATDDDPAGPTTAGTAGPSDARRRLHIDLVHRHLPKLEDAGAVAVEDDAVTLEAAGRDLLAARDDLEN